MGGKTLHDSFDTLVIEPSVRELIEQGYPAKFQYFSAPLKVDLQKIRIDAFGDFREGDMSRVLDRQDIIGDVVKCYLENAAGRQAIVYCINVHHSKHTAKCFNEAGIHAAHLDGDTPKYTRRDIIEKFRRGEFTILCNVNLFGEGIDVPNMDCVILTRPTRSFTLYCQQAMRALRPAPDKQSIIIDLVENHSRFAKIDEPIAWSLDPNEMQGVGLAPVKTCPECGKNEIPTGTRTCKAVIARHNSIKAIEQTTQSLSIIYQATAPVTREGWLVLADHKTALNLEFISNGEALVSDEKIERRRIAQIIQQPYINEQPYRLSIECSDDNVSIKKANITHADGTSFDTPVLCDTDGRVLKYFIDADGNLICGHIFNIHVTRIDEDGIIVKIYESEQPAQILLDERNSLPIFFFCDKLPRVNDLNGRNRYDNRNEADGNAREHRKCCAQDRKSRSSDTSVDRRRSHHRRRDRRQKIDRQPRSQHARRRR